MEDYIKKAADAFLVERPYGMRVDYDVDEIPLEGEIIKEHAGFTDVFFYSDCTNPYAGYVLDLKKLKVYNQYMFPLAMVLNMKL